MNPEDKKISLAAGTETQAENVVNDIIPPLFYTIPPEKKSIFVVWFDKISHQHGKPLAYKWLTLIEKCYKAPLVVQATNEQIALDSGRLKDHGGFVFGRTNEGRKKEADILTRTALNFDIDEFEDEMQFETLKEAAAGWDFNYVLHSTFKSTRYTPRVRLIIPLAQPIEDVSLYSLTCKNFAERFLPGIIVDEASYRPYQVMYRPVVPSQRADDYILFYRAGDNYFNYHYIEPTQDQLEKKELHAVQEKCSSKDPTTYAGIRGAFNRYRTPDQLFDELYSDQYQRAKNGRFHLTGASSSAGVVILDGNRAYSFHSNNDKLCDGKAHDSFDIFRILSAGGDEKKAKKLLKDNKDFMIFWKKKQETPMDIPGKFYNDNGNLIVDPELYEFLQSEDENLKGTIGYNLRECKIAPIADLPWRKVDPIDDEWTAEDDTRLRNYLNKRYRVYNEKACRDALLETAHKQEFHPLKTFIESKEWDGKERLDTYFIDYLDLPDTPYHRLVARLFIMGVIFRTYEPGKRFTFVPILCGPEGAGKSSILRRLALDKYFVGDLEDYNSKDTKMKYRWAMIVEDSEGRAFKKSQSEDVKAAVAETVDTFRPPYGSNLIRVPRHCVFAMTLNQTRDFLPEVGENRRYLPIECYRNNRLGRIGAKPEEVIPDEVVQQILAEGLKRYLDGERPVMTEEEQIIVNRERNQYRKTPDLTLEIADLITNRWIADDYHKLPYRNRHSYVFNVNGDKHLQKYICTKEILDLLNIDPYRRAQLEKNPEPINRALESLGWVRMKTPRNNIDSYYGSQRFFERPESHEPEQTPKIDRELYRGICSLYLQAKNYDEDHADHIVNAALSCGWDRFTNAQAQKLIEDLQTLISIETENRRRLGY